MSTISLWYAARATGMVTVILITASVLLGILGPLRVASPGWPRFALAGLHRNISLLTLAFVGVHVVTVAADSYVPITIVDTVVPFVGAHEPFWLGLGTVAFDLMLALVATSLARPRINLRLWRVLHWGAYACWPLAIAHGLGIGTDAGGGWALWLSLTCAAAVLAAGGWRAAHARRLAGRKPLGGRGGALVSPGRPA